MMMSLRLLLLQGRFAVARLDPGERIPSWARGEFVSITRTDQELSIVCEETAVPESARSESGFRCLRVEGPLPFEIVGVAAALATPLAGAKIPILLIATHDTDYILIAEMHLNRAITELRAAGHVVSRRKARVSAA